MNEEKRKFKGIFKSSGKKNIKEHKKGVLNDKLKATVLSTIAIIDLVSIQQYRRFTNFADYNKSKLLVITSEMDWHFPFLKTIPFIYVTIKIFRFYNKDDRVV